MSMPSDHSPEIQAIEALILEKFRLEPFHNLHMLYGVRFASSAKGGTCSDKTLSFVSAARKQGFDASLHVAKIAGKDIHRLARVQIGGRIFFADVGNGWPALKLYPSDVATRYVFFGMQFRTEIYNGAIAVFHTRNGKESLQIRIELPIKNENEIMAGIAKRFSSGIIYPFSNSLRFAQVIDDRFLFLRGERLEIYSKDRLECIDGVEKSQVPSILLHYFNFRLDKI